MKKILMLIVLIDTLFSLSIISQQDNDFSCFTILVGKNASADGSVLVGHNEDNYGDTFTDWHKLPRIKHKPGNYQVFLSGDSIAEIEQTNACLWITVSQFNAEQYLNEWGVTITSDASRSNVIDGNGRIVQCLRKIVAERAHTAREAVQLAGSLVDKYGYDNSGRIYSIADPNEAWALEVVNGCHWVAARVPDDEIVLVPNYYVIDYIDLSDSVNFLASADIIGYAVLQGWFDPENGEPFNFRKAYCRSDRMYSMTNIARKWAALNILSEKQYGIYDEFPFSFRPKHKVGIRDMMIVLQNHYEGTEFEMNPAYSNGDPHNNTTTMRICSKNNTFSTIAQLRNWLPVDIGCILWTAPRYPCIQPYIPWYYGITKIPAGYENEGYELALENFLNKDRNFRELYPDAGYWVFRDFASQVEKNYGEQIDALKTWKEQFQSEAFLATSAGEAEIAEIYQTDPETARKKLTEITTSFAEKALSETKRRLAP
jgi:dipeptidase